jgi:hypothetical protein
MINSLLFDEFGSLAEEAESRLVFKEA